MNRVPIEKRQRTLGNPPVPEACQRHVVKAVDICERKFACVTLPGVACPYNLPLRSSVHATPGVYEAAARDLATTKALRRRETAQ
jgi:hypothetical protein